MEPGTTETLQILMPRLLAIEAVAAQLLAASSLDFGAMHDAAAQGVFGSFAEARPDDPQLDAFAIGFQAALDRLFLAATRVRRQE